MHNLHTYEIPDRFAVLKDQIIESCRFLLLPVVRFLLKHGVSWAEFSELAKEAYVVVARDEYGVQGRPTNNSRVAMLTGISRREVASVRDRILDATATAPALQGNRISQVLTGWHTDSEFLDPSGAPLVLPAEGKEASFEALLRRYAGDLPHGAVRKEMVNRGLLETADDGTLRVLKRDYVYSALDPEIVRRMSVALNDHATTLEHNLDEKRSTETRFEGMADEARIPVSRVSEFRELVERRGMAFLEEIDTWLSRHASGDEKAADTRSIRLGAGVYLVHDESKRG